jgi:EamA-like transporter family
LFLILSGLATGGSWVCYFRALKIGKAAQVAPIDKLSVVLVAVFGVIVLGDASQLARRRAHRAWRDPCCLQAMSDGFGPEAQKRADGATCECLGVP